MAKTSIRKATDHFGEEWTYYNENGNLTFYSQIDVTPVVAFALPAADTSFDVSIRIDDTWEVGYLDASEVPQRMTSQDNGQTWA